jgi:hypothetical protein
VPLADQVYLCISLWRKNEFVFFTSLNVAKFIKALPFSFMTLSPFVTNILSTGCVPTRALNTQHTTKKI